MKYSCQEVHKCHWCILKSNQKKDIYVLDNTHITYIKNKILHKKKYKICTHKNNETSNKINRNL